ncbi:signal peptidase II [Microbacterium resistens]|uniref:signal peptidase II n=1 Tax=Microbacterium resistens TaxID=156977 RepID=UPI000B2BB1EC
MTARGTGLRAFETPGAYDESSPGPKVAKRPARALGITLPVAGIGLILDQGTKALATTQLEPGDRVPLVGDLLSLSLVYNPGAAFSIGSGSTWVFTIIGVLAATVITAFAARLRGIRWGIALGLILGGAVGNLLDRLVKPPSFGQGYVTDFIAYGNLFVGNVADVLVVVGVALLCLILITTSQKTKTPTSGNTGSAPVTDRADRPNPEFMASEREN